jgi:hypothetical protein
MIAFALSLLACFPTTKEDTGDTALDTASGGGETGEDTVDTSGDDTGGGDSGAETGNIDTGSDSGGTDTGGGDTGSGGPSVGISELAAGDLVVTEVMFNPHGLSAGGDGSDSSDSTGEWFEIYNAKDVAVNLRGLVLTDVDSTRAQTHTIASDVVVAAGSYVVLGNSTSRSVNGDVPVAYAWPADGSWTLGNNAGDEIVLKAGSLVIDAVAYTNADSDGDGVKDWPDVKGFSMSLNVLDASGNDLPANWCLPVDTFGPEIVYDVGGNRQHGTPGAANGGCTTVTLPSGR